MTNTALPLRNWVTIGVCTLLALVVGYSLAEPTSSRTVLLAAMVIGVLSIPLLLRWHHPLLIVSWNAWIMVPLLPGSVSLWIFLAFVSLGFSILNRTLQQRNDWISVPSVAWPLVVIGIVTVITMWSTQGLGGRALGQDQWGAAKYLGIFGAVVGYFALTARPIPRRWARILLFLFFASAATAAGATLAYELGPSFYFLFAMLPADLLAFQFESSPHAMVRYWGLSPAGRAICFAMIAHYGLRGLTEWRRSWRGVVFCLVFLIGMFGGFRAYILLLGLVLACQFYFERLHRTRHLLHVLLAFVVIGVVLVVFLDRMPLAIQRALSFLPIEVHPEARRDASGTLEWRLLMWKHVVPEIPQYLLLGKGFAFSGVDYVLTQEAIKRHLIFSAYDAAMISGAYHHGILTLIIPLGLPGLLAFLWFAWASLRVLHKHYKHGDPALQRANTFLLAFFVAQLIFYLTLYGQFERDFPLFVGVIGISICLNRGVTQDSKPADDTMIPADSTEPQPPLAPAPAGSI